MQGFDVGLPCPTCGHLHPGGMGVQICGCKDCLLLWMNVNPEVLTPEFREKIAALKKAQIDARYA